MLRPSENQLLGTPGLKSYFTSHLWLVWKKGTDLVASKRTAGSSSWGQKTPDTFTHTRTNSLILFLLKHLYSSFLFSFKREGGKWHCFGLQNRCQFELYFASKYLVWLCGAWVEKYLPIPKRLSELCCGRRAIWLITGPVVEQRELPWPQFSFAQGSQHWGSVDSWGQEITGQMG